MLDFWNWKTIVSLTVYPSTLVAPLSSPIEYSGRKSQHMLVLMEVWMRFGLYSNRVFDLSSSEKGSLVFGKFNPKCRKIIKLLGLFLEGSTLVEVVEALLLHFCNQKLTMTGKSEKRIRIWISITKTYKYWAWACSMRFFPTRQRKGSILLFFNFARCFCFFFEIFSWKSHRPWSCFFLMFLIYIINLNFLQSFCSIFEPAGPIRNFNAFVFPKEML